jgi:hypothetical protein
MELATLKQFAPWLFWLFIVGLAFSWVLSFTPIGRDDTDKGAWGGGRSGSVFRSRQAKTARRIARSGRFLRGSGPRWAR